MPEVSNEIYWIFTLLALFLELVFFIIVLYLIDKTHQLNSKIDNLGTLIGELIDVQEDGEE